jgi:hypothetical protein
MSKYMLIAAVILPFLVTPANAVECYEATATVSQNAKGCTDTEKGYANTGKGPKDHDGCTAAKAQARDKLMYRLQESCKGSTQTNTSCSVIKVPSCS